MISMLDALKFHLQQGLIYRVQDLNDGQNSFSLRDNPSPSIHHDVMHFCREISLFFFPVCYATSFGAGNKFEINTCWYC